MSMLRYAWRSIAKHPLCLTLSTVTLGLGIGVCVSNFATLDALVLRPLLLPDVDRLVIVGRPYSASPDLAYLSPSDYYLFAERLTTLESVGGFGFDSVNVSNDGAEPERLDGARVVGDFFNALGIQPLLGRGFLAEESQPGHGRVVVLSEGAWKRRYGADRGIIGREIQIDGEAHQIVGVMPREARVPPQAQIWLPWQFGPDARSQHRDFFIQGMARLKPGVTLRAAQAELASLSERQRTTYPDTHRGFTASAALIREQVSGGETTSYSWMMVVSSLFLLLLACSNVANLHYARMTARAREFALRSALGANRWQVAGQLLSESAILGLLGGAAGICLGAWGVDLTRGSMPAAVEVFLPGWQRMSVNSHVFAAAAAVSLLAGLLAGVASAASSLWATPGAILKDGGRSSAGGRNRHRVRSLLVISQLVLSIILLTGAGLILRGFQRIADPKVGGDPTRILTADVTLPISGYPAVGEVRRFHRDLAAKLTALPGVKVSALASDIPYGQHRSIGPISLEGRLDPVNQDDQRAQHSAVTPGFFATLGIPVIRGRSFTAADREDAVGTAVVNEAFVRRYFADGSDPIGRRLRIGRGPAAAANPWLEVVGVSRDVRYHPADIAAEPLIYRPLDQAPPRQVTVVLQSPTTAGALSLAQSVRRIVRELDRQQPVAEVDLFSNLISNQVTGFWYVAAIMGVVGMLALLLSAVGIYSVMAFFVTERTHEIGIRMAMGAAHTTVLRQVIRQGFKLVAIGLAIGFPAALLVARALGGLLFGVTATDAPSLSGAVFVLVAAALLACWIPACRAASVSPMEALRHS